MSMSIYPSTTSHQACLIARHLRVRSTKDNARSSNNKSTSSKNNCFHLSTPPTPTPHSSPKRENKRLPEFDSYLIYLALKKGEKKTQIEGAKGNQLTHYLF